MIDKRSFVASEPISQPAASLQDVWATAQAHVRVQATSLQYNPTLDPEVTLRLLRRFAHEQTTGFTWDFFTFTRGEELREALAVSGAEHYCYGPGPVVVVAATTPEARRTLAILKNRTLLDELDP